MVVFFLFTLYYNGLELKIVLGGTKWITRSYMNCGLQILILMRTQEKNLKPLKMITKRLKTDFIKILEFGTAGLRGVIGAGTNRMNIYTVRRATQGLANYIIKMNGQDKGVAIAFDSRHMSPEFADEAALCLNANGIKAYVFDSLRPTPELSFAVRAIKVYRRY